MVYMLTPAKLQTGLGYVEMPSQEKTTKIIHEHAFHPLYLVLPFWILWISTSSATNNTKCTHNRIAQSPDLHPWIFVSALLEGHTEPAQ